MARFDERPSVKIEEVITEKTAINKFLTEEKKHTARNFYLTSADIKALGFMATEEMRDKSEIVRASLKQYIPAKYYDMHK